MNTPAPFIWYDLMTPDVPAAAAFYSAVLGWTAADSGMPGVSYTIIKAEGRDVGGMMAVPAGSGLAPQWMAYIHCNDVDAESKRAATLGGRVCKQPEDIPGVGRFAVIADPHGAMFNLFKPMGEQAPGEAPANAPGSVGWRELRAGNGAEAWAFYSKLFGWTASTAMDMGPLGVYQIFKTGGADDVGAMMTKSSEQKDSAWFFYFNVAGLDAAVARLKDGGGRLTAEAMEVPGGQWVVHAVDPQGAAFGLVAPRR